MSSAEELTTLFHSAPCWLGWSAVSLTWDPVTMVEPMKSQLGIPKPPPEKEKNTSRKNGREIRSHAERRGGRGNRLQCEHARGLQKLVVSARDHSYYVYRYRSQKESRTEDKQRVMSFQKKLNSSSHM